jgi:hypothetical protein
MRCPGARTLRYGAAWAPGPLPGDAAEEFGLKRENLRDDSSGRESRPVRIGKGDRRIVGHDARYDEAPAEASVGLRIAGDGIIGSVSSKDAAYSTSERAT